MKGDKKMNFHDDTYILETMKHKINRHVKPYLEKSGDSWLCAFYKGSANYNLDRENSDVDMVVVILPSKETLFYGNDKDKTNTTLYTKPNSNDDKIEFVTLRKFLLKTLHSELEMIKVMSSPYVVYNEKLNTKLLLKFDDLRKYKTVLPYCNLHHFYFSTLNMCRSNLLSLKRDEETNRVMNVEENYKRLTHVLLGFNLIRDVLKGLLFMPSAYGITDPILNKLTNRSQELDLQEIARDVLDDIDINYDGENFKIRYEKYNSVSQDRQKEAEEYKKEVFDFYNYYMSEFVYRGDE